MNKKLFSIYQAAVLLGISPKLLTYFTKRAVKSKDPRKLRSTTNESHLYFEEEELKSYDDWLKAPWPAPPKTRPHLPDAIRDEIKIEANMECAVCCKSGEAGEAAHIEPIKHSKCNHPHNLIWLCSNHHVKFDNGCFGPKGASNEIIRSLKNALQHFKRFSWQGQADVSQQIATVLHLCKELEERLKAPINSAERMAVERTAKNVLDLIPSLAEQPQAATVKHTLSQLSEELETERNNSVIDTRKQLEIAMSYEDEYLQKSGLKRCPLCQGGNSHSFYDCSVCGGDGSISSSYHPDLTPFEKVNCGLCHGTCLHNHLTCPVCAGDGKIERRFHDIIDYNQYDDVTCPHCDGTTRYNYEDCPVCNAEGSIPRRVLDDLNLRDFQHVDCPCCNGSGFYNYNTCMACNGDRTMQRRYAAEINLSEYENVKCPACKGSRTLYGEQCPACNGEGYMPALIANQIDTALYKLVKCPECKGKKILFGDDCLPCNGEGEMLKLYADKYH